jgi:chromosome partitioning protein
VIRLVMANQKGGVAKTSSALSLAWFIAQKGLKVLLVDLDPQGSISTALGIKPEAFLYHLLVMGQRFKDCVVNVRPNIDVIPGNRMTTDAEQILVPRPGRELALKAVIVDAEYDAVILDCPPAISLFQTCAMIYAEQVLIPVTMDPLSFQGAVGAITGALSLNQMFRAEIKPIGLLPVMVDRRLQMTEIVMESIDKLAQSYGTPVLPSVRVDSTIPKCTRSHKFLAEYDPKCKAAQDYEIVTTQLLAQLRSQLDGKQFQSLSA